MTAKPKASPAAKPAVKPVPQAVEPRGFAGFLHHQFKRLRGTKPDHSVDGFLAAIKLAIDYCGKRDWNTAEDMEEEMEAQMCAALRTPPGTVSVEFVARNRESKQPRLLILTEWGLREAVEGQLSFNLHFKPEPRRLQPVK